MNEDMELPCTSANSRLSDQGSTCHKDSRASLSDCATSALLHFDTRGGDLHTSRKFVRDDLGENYVTPVESRRSYSVCQFGQPRNEQHYTKECLQHKRKACSLLNSYRSPTHLKRFCTQTPFSRSPSEISDEEASVIAAIALKNSGNDPGAAVHLLHRMSGSF
uniref:Uncharacterized protein n=1 Tax=Tetraselmis sp. GSL018 TaxID=582737 RepID=A0A061RYI7_9CHLO